MRNFDAILFVLLSIGVLYTIVSVHAETLYDDDSIKEDLKRLDSSIDKLEDETRRDYLKKQSELMQNQLKTTDIAEKTKKGVKAAATKTKIRDAINSFNNALPRLLSGETYEILRGVGDLVSGIGMTFGGPYGFIFGFVGGLFSGIMGLLGPKKVEKSTRQIIDEALQDQYDEELKDKANGFKTVIVNYKRSQKSFETILMKGITPSESAVNRLAPPIKVEEKAEFFGILESRIKRTPPGDVAAKKAIKLVVLFGELCELHWSNLLVIVGLINLSKMLPGVAIQVQGSADGIHDLCKRNLEFLRAQGDQFGPSKYQLMSNFYPPEQSASHILVDQFLTSLGIPAIPKFNYLWKWKYNVQPVKFPGIQICAFKNGVYYGNVKTSVKGIDNIVKGCPSKKETWLSVRRRTHRFFELQANVYNDPIGDPASYIGYKSICLDKRIRYSVIVHLGECEDDTTLFTFTPIKPNRSRFLISFKKYPGRFLYMDGDDDKKLKLSNGDPGEAGYWT